MLELVALAKYIVWLGYLVFLVVNAHSEERGDIMSKINKKYWNPYEILPYQRHFNFINGERSIGKSYSLEMFLIDRFLNRNEQFIYLVRTKDDKKSGAMDKGFSKVLMQQFPELMIECTIEEMIITREDETGEEYKSTMGYCIALSESVKIKKNSYPHVYWMMFDEYMLEKKQGAQYVNGWDEPDLLLSIYHTVDREEDRVTLFALGNNTSFYNPYHLHKAFNIPFIERGGLWYSENVLFQWAVATGELVEEKNKCKFLKMISDTKYGTYAKDGNYIDDNASFLMELDNSFKNTAILYYKKKAYGVWANGDFILISDKYDPSNKRKLALTTEDHFEETVIAKRGNIFIDWIIKFYKLGQLRYSSMEIKAQIEEGVIQYL